MLHRRGGFTLLEVIVVIGIIGILVGCCAIWLAWLATTHRSLTAIRVLLGLSAIAAILPWRIPTSRTAEMRFLSSMT